MITGVSKSGRPSVLVVYQHLPHYRYGVFTRLDERPDLQVEFAAGSDDFEPGIPLISPASLSVVHPLRNWWCGPVLWQHGLLRLMLRGDHQAVVFLGNVAYVSTWVAAAVARLRRRRVLFWTIGWHRPEQGPRRLIRLAFYRLANRLLLYGDVAAQIGSSLGYPASRMSIVYNSATPLPEEESPPEITDHDLDRVLPTSGPHMITAVARLTDRKRFDLLLDAVAALKDRGRSVIVLLVGEGPSRHDLEHRANRLRIDLRMPGSVYSETKLARIYERSSVTVVPSRAGLSTIQSLAHGRPVITHDDPNDQVPEWEAIEPGVTGEHYRHGSVSALAGAIVTVLNRFASDPVGIDAACRRVVDTRWNPQVHADLVANGIHLELGRVS